MISKNEKRCRTVLPWTYFRPFWLNVPPLGPQTDSEPDRSAIGPSCSCCSAWWTRFDNPILCRHPPPPPARLFLYCFYTRFSKRPIYFFFYCHTSLFFLTFPLLHLLLFYFSVPLIPPHFECSQLSTACCPLLLKCVHVTAEERQQVLSL
jgi:hypothetical protein